MNDSANVKDINSDRVSAAKYRGSSRTVLAISLVSILLFTSIAIAFVGSVFRPSMICGMRVKVDEHPNDHSAFQEWLNEQPYIVCRSVHVDDNDRLTVAFISNQNLWGYPRLPDLESRCEELGYEIGNRKFEHFRDDE